MALFFEVLFYLEYLEVFLTKKVNFLCIFLNTRLEKDMKIL